MTNDLKPVRCGCGGEAKVETDHYTLVPGKPNDYWKRVSCSECNIRTTWRTTEAKAIMAWNKAMGERTVKATRKPEAFFYRCECGYGLCCEKNDINYCPQCGARLEWE